MRVDTFFAVLGLRRGVLLPDLCAHWPWVTSAVSLHQYDYYTHDFPLINVYLVRMQTCLSFRQQEIEPNRVHLCDPTMTPSISPNAMCPSP